MQFWIYQERAKRLSLRLILIYAVCLAGFAVVSAMAIELAWVNIDIYSQSRYRYFNLFLPHPLYLVNTRFMIILTCLLLAVLIASLLAPVRAASSGRSVAEKLGGRRLNSNKNNNPAERRLLNVVEEIAIASGMPVPPVYVLDQDKGINAFAAGATQNDAVIGVTRGALKYLTRDELQAVIGHEFSHILNGDVRLNMRMAQLLFGLMFMAELGALIWRGIKSIFSSTSEGGGGGGGHSSGGRSSGGSRRSSSSSSGGGAGAIVLVILAIIIISLIFGCISKFFGLIVQAAVCRQREYLADASSVQFTRTTALASALKKIGALGPGKDMARTSSSYSQFFFAPIKRDLFSAHPPLASRIRRIDPSWDGDYGKAKPINLVPVKKTKSQGGQIPAEAANWSLGLMAPPSGHSAAATENTRAELAEAAREPLGACNLALAMLLPDSGPMRASKLRWEYASRREEIKQLRKMLDTLPCRDYLPVLELCAASFKALSARQAVSLQEDMLSYIKHDKIFSFGEWVIYQAVLSLAGVRNVKIAKKPSKADVAEACGKLLTALVCSHKNPDEGRKAFEASNKHFGQNALKLHELPEPEALEESLNVLRRANSGIQTAFMHGLRRMVLHDRVINEEEAMFTQMIALCLGMPAPPFLQKA